MVALQVHNPTDLRRLAPLLQSMYMCFAAAQVLAPAHNRNEMQQLSTHRDD